MNINELTQNDKNMDFKPLNIKKEVQDEVMEFFQFKNVGQMFEAGVLNLQSFAAMSKLGFNEIYFVKDDNGKKVAITLNLSKLIETIKDPNRPEGSTHGLRVELKSDKK